MTSKSQNKEISIGWDVGGWSGKNHGFCVLVYENSRMQLLKSVKLNVFEVKENLESLLNEYSSTHQITIGIDAPLQFPNLFKEIMLSKPVSIFEKIKNKPNENPVAWRKTDLFIKQNFGKTPLSASFSFLTSNATVAISMIRELQTKWNDISVLPLDQKSDINVIEVYPGLLKSPKIRNSNLLTLYQNLVTQLYLGGMIGFDYYFGESPQKSDVADGVICALFALGLNNSSVAPSLEVILPKEMESAAMTEGWIYYPKLA